MKYLKSPMFVLGVVLVVAGLLAGDLLRPILSRTVLGSWFAFTAQWEEFDLRAPAGLVITGLIFAIVGATRANGGMKP